MAEQTSREAALVAANTKLSNTVGAGVKRNISITSPATVTWADGDTIASPILLPTGTRFTCGSYISCADMGTSIVAAVGIRDVDGVEIDLDGIAASVDVATAAARAIANSGALVAAGVNYVTLKPSYLVLTLSGGTPTANAQIRADIEVVFPG